MGQSNKDKGFEPQTPLTGSQHDLALTSIAITLKRMADMLREQHDEFMKGRRRNDD